MSIRVRDPSGVEWTVYREWFGMPTWARRKRPDDVLTGTDLAGVGVDGDDLAGLFVAIAAAAVAVVVLVVLVAFLLPLVFLVVGLVVAALALAARLLSLTAWTIRARGGDRTLSWRVTGVRRSRRALHEVATTLERGEEPSVEGIAGKSS